MKGVVDYQKVEHGPDAPRMERLVRKDWTWQITAYLMFIFSIFGLIYTCDFPLLSTPFNEEDRSKHGLYFQILCIHALTSTHLTMSMMFAHVTQRKYEPLFGNRVLCFVLFACAMIQVIYQILRAIDPSQEIVDIMEFLRVSVSLLLYSVLVGFVHFLVNSINEMADGLGIRVFQVKPKKKLVVQ